MAAKKPHKQAAGEHDGKHDGKQDAADVKARMLAALEAKNNRSKDVPHDNAPAKQKANGPEVLGAAGPKMHRRKSG